MIDATDIFSFIFFYSFLLVYVIPIIACKRPLPLAQNITITPDIILLA